MLSASAKRPNTSVSTRKPHACAVKIPALRSVVYQYCQYNVLWHAGREGGAEPMIRHRSPCKNPLRVSAVHSALVVKPTRGHRGGRGTCKWSQYVPLGMRCQRATLASPPQSSPLPRQRPKPPHSLHQHAQSRASCSAKSKRTQVSVMTRQERWQMAVILRFG